MRLTQKTLEKLPTVRLWISLKTWFTVPYMNARKQVRLPVARKDFKSNGKGLPWICGVSNAILGHKDLFNHPVFYAHTTGSTVYVVAMLTKGGLPKFAFRYRHRGHVLVKAYDASRKDSSKEKVFLELLEKQPFLTLEKGRYEARKGAHTPGAQSGHREVGAPYGDKNKKGLVGAKRRAVIAGFIPEGLSI
jgi:hypothetical protein